MDWPTLAARRTPLLLDDGRIHVLPVAVEPHRVHVLRLLLPRDARSPIGASAVETHALRWTPGTDAAVSPWPVAPLQGALHTTSAQIAEALILAHVCGWPVRLRYEQGSRAGLWRTCWVVDLCGVGVRTTEEPPVTRRPKTRLYHLDGVSGVETPTSMLWIHDGYADPEMGRLWPSEAA